MTPCTLRSDGVKRCLRAWLGVLPGIGEPMDFPLTNGFQIQPETALQLQDRRKFFRGAVVLAHRLIPMG
jgi:hypothetical protein